MKRFKRIKVLCAAGLSMAVLLGGCAATGSPESTLTPTTEPTPVVSATPAREVRWPAGIDFTQFQGKSITIVDPFFEAYDIPQIREEFCQKYGVSVSRYNKPSNQHFAENLEMIKYLVVLDSAPTLFAGISPIASFNVIPQGAMQGLLQPVDKWLDALDNTFIPEMLENNSWRGKHYCLQYTHSPLNRKGTTSYKITYKISELAQRGLEDPFDLYLKGEWTWDKLREVSRAFNEIGPDGRALPSSTGLPMTGELVSAALRFNGAHIYQEKNGELQVTLQQRAAQEMLGILNDAVNSGDFVYKNSMRTLSEKSARQTSICFYPSIMGATTTAEGDKTLRMGVPLPTGPSCEISHPYYVSDYYSVLLKGAPHPEIGFALLWYIGNFAPADEDLDTWFERDANLKDKQHLKRYYQAMESMLEHADQIICPDICEGIPGLPEALGGLYIDMFGKGMPLSQAMEEYIPRMQRALDALVMEAVPDP
nr:hypothetical protein [bacterium]